MLQNEILKNKQIMNLAKSTYFDKDSKKLSLADQNLTDLSFLPKMISDFTKLEILDLSNSDLRSKTAVKQLCQMVDENGSLKTLKVRNCKINASTLTILAGALTKACNENLRCLDISDNPIQDSQYKMLFGLLQNNQSLTVLEYTLYDDENRKNLKKFRTSRDKNFSSYKLTTSMIGHEGHGHGNGHHAIPRWQKICFPIWLWKSLIHDKHEAFRFKYDTAKITDLE